MSAKQPHSHRLRTGRRSIPNQIYMVTTVTRQRRQYFVNFNSSRQLIKCLRLTKPYAQTLAFVVMPDHLHWMLQLGGEKSLSKVVGFMKAHTTRSLNVRIGNEGSIWEDGFHDHAIRREESLRDCARYIIANPLRAGLAKSVGDYPHWDCIWF